MAFVRGACFARRCDRSRRTQLVSGESIAATRSVKPKTRGAIRMVSLLAQFQTGTKVGGPERPPSGWTLLRIVCFCSVFIVTLATGQTAWAQQGSQENTGPLPPPPPSAAPFVETA